MVLLKINTLGNGCKVLIQARDISGKLGWLAALNGDLHIVMMNDESLLEGATMIMYLRPAF